MQDVREEILRYTRGEQATAAVIVDDEGIIAGTTAAKKEADNLGLSLEKTLNEGSHVTKGDEVIRFSGTPKQIVMAEETLIGILAKPSGIATSASRFVKATGGRPRVVCGAWKKMPPCFILSWVNTAGRRFTRLCPERISARFGSIRWEMSNRDSRRRMKSLKTSFT